jgi:hypothetical protein
VIYVSLSLFSGDLSRISLVTGHALYIAGIRRNGRRSPRFQGATVIISLRRLKQVDLISFTLHMIFCNMNSMTRDPIEDSIEVSALVVCVEVGKRHLPSRYPVISNQFIVNYRFSMLCDRKDPRNDPNISNAHQILSDHFDAMVCQ